MEIVPDYFFSQCSFEEQFIQITKYKIWYRPTSLFKVNFCYIYKNYLHKTQLFCVFMLLFLTMLPPDWYLFFSIKLHLDFSVKFFTLFHVSSSCRERLHAWAYVVSEGRMDSLSGFRKPCQLMSVNAQGNFAAGQNHPQATNQCLNAPS